MREEGLHAMRRCQVCGARCYGVGIGQPLRWIAAHIAATLRIGSVHSRGVVGQYPHMEVLHVP